MVKKQARSAPNPYRTSGSDAELSPANQLAHDIVSARPDHLPSVEHIMNGGGDDATATAALHLFNAALTSPGDPHRDPRVALAAAAPGRGV